jgi:hypothetical protein
MRNGGDHTMSTLTLGAAAKLAGVSKSTLSRAIKAGRMSAAGRRDDGGYEIDAAELCRVFPARTPAEDDATGGSNGAMTRHATVDATALAEMRLRAELADQRVTFLKDQLQDVKVDRDHWRTQAEAQQRLLADATAKAQRPWWRRLAG